MKSFTHIDAAEDFAAFDVTGKLVEIRELETVQEGGII